VAGHGEKMSRKQEQAIIGLIKEPTIPAAAESAGISPTTLTRWLQKPEFQSRYRAMRRQVVERSIAELQDATTEAVDALRVVMGDETAPANARVNAARAVLSYSLEAINLFDLEERVKTLERAIE
jgi:DNA-binding MurR/RpiR family transcriptional regulator